MTDRDSKHVPARDRPEARGSFDIIGDVHGCTDELEDLLRMLGYGPDASSVWRSQEGRIAIFIGDLADRGPRNVDALRLAMRMVAAGAALWVPGNHDVRLERYLAGAERDLVHGLDTTAREIEREPPEFRREVLAVLRSLPSHYVLDDARLVVAHAGLPERLHGIESPEVRRLAAWGVEDEHDVDPSDHAKRHPWLASYRGRAVVVYGHTAIIDAAWQGATIDIDTGCVFGGRLTALRWPERSLVSTPSRRAYAPTPGVLGHRVS